MELFKIFGTLALMGADNVNKQLDDVTGKANNTQDKFSSACKKIGTALACCHNGWTIGSVICQGYNPSGYKQDQCGSVLFFCEEGRGRKPYIHI